MDAEWLKETVGDALSIAMLDLAKNQPQDPIDYLGKHLIHYVETKEREQAESELVQVAKQVGIEREVQAAQALERSKQQAEQAERERQAREASLEQVRTPCQVEFSELKHGTESSRGVADDLAVLSLEKINDTIDAVKSNTSAHNVYIGKKNDDGSITFIASTDPTLLQRRLVDTQDDDGVSQVLPFDVFTQVPEDDTDEQDDEELQEEEGEKPEKPAKDSLPKFVHVQNVLEDDRVPFFGRVPTLGSFLAVKVAFQEAIHANAIPEDGGLIVEEEEGDDTQQEETSEPAEEDAGASEDQEEEKEAKEGEGQPDADQAETEEQTQPPKEKRWRSNVADSSLVICIDTLGVDGFQNGFSEQDVLFVRQAAEALGLALTKTSLQRFQEEMIQRDRIVALDEEGKPVIALEKQETEGTIAQQTEEFDKQFTPTETSEEEENTDAAADGEQPNEEENTAAPQVPEEEKTLKRAVIALEAAKARVGAAAWWKNHMRASYKLCIPPSQDVHTAFCLFLRIFGLLDNPEATWEDVKAVQLDALFEKVQAFDVSEPGAEACANLTEESALGFLDELEALAVSEESPAWIQALAYLSQYYLVAAKASSLHAAYLAQLEAQRKEEEAQLAAQAEAEGQAEGDANENDE